MSFLGLLTIVFIVLKLIGTIEWDWFYVMLPLLVQTILIVVLLSLTAYLKNTNSK